MEKKNKLLSCFGKLEAVFPVGQDGLRETPESCMACVDKTACLKSAVAGADGLKVQEEGVDRAYASGMITFFQRWSRKKQLRHQVQAMNQGQLSRRES
ncbi:MAG: hypothetical protein KKH68_12190 [Proteobacteria bacterium]|nr:hypothetical protein [Pseudomonadota bacterium]